MLQDLLKADAQAALLIEKTRLDADARIRSHREHAQINREATRAEAQKTAAREQARALEQIRADLEAVEVYYLNKTADMQSRCAKEKDMWVDALFAQATAV